MSDRFLQADEVAVGATVYLVQDTPDGPEPMAWCERREQGFTGLLLGDVVVASLQWPNDGRRLVTQRPTPAELPKPEPKPAPAESWVNASWLVLDTETTGLTDAGIVELGAVVMRQGRVLTHRSALYNPGKPIEPGAAGVHGITDAMVAHRPRITDKDPRSGRLPAEGLDTLAAEYDCRALVGYNLIRFDLPILRRELGPRFVELEAGIGPTVDPLVVVRMDGVGARWSGKGRHKLTAVAARFGLDTPEPAMKSQAHRAVWDCVLAGRVLWHLREHLPTDEAGVRSLMAVEGERQCKELDAYWAARGQR